jgi:hypothetical protein
MRKFHFLRPSEIANNVDYDLRDLRQDSLVDLSVFFKMYYTLEFAIGQVLTDCNEDCYPNASFSVLRFISGLRVIRTASKGALRFLDVGCGLGTKVTIAGMLGFDAYGLEVNPRYAEIAGECVGKSRILCCDGISFPSYKDFDVIYFYNPTPAGDLETVIINRARKGAIIYHAIGLHTKPERAIVRLSSRVMRVLGGCRGAPRSVL